MAEAPEDINQKQDRVFRKLLVDLKGHLNIPSLFSSLKTIMKTYLPEADLSTNDFLEICKALERRGYIACNNLQILKDATKTLDVTAYNKILNAEEKILRNKEDEESTYVSQTSEKPDKTSLVHPQDRSIQTESAVITERDLNCSHDKVTSSATFMASTFRSAQIPIRARGSKKCILHRNTEVLLVCKECDGELICGQCVVDFHNRHEVTTISDVIPQAKETIKVFVNKTKCKYLPTFDAKVNNLDEEISRNDSHYKNVIAKIKTQNESLKLKLDKITDKLIMLCKEYKSQDDYIMKTYKMELQFKIKKLNEQLQELECTLQFGTDIQIYDTSREISNDVTFPTLPSLKDMDFNPTSILINKLENMFGQLTKMNNGNQVISPADDVTRPKTHTPSNIARAITDTDKKRTAILYSSTEKCQSSNLNKGSEDVVKFKLFKTFSHPWSICKIKAISGENQVWVKHSCSTLALLNTSGQVQKTLEMEVVIQDFCVSPSTGDIWFCSHSDSSVRKVTGNMSTVQFRTDRKPESICISADGKILVGMARQIVKYTQCGQILCKSEHRKELSMVKLPDSISLCPLTRHIAVVDWDKKDYGGDGRRSVLIFSEDLQLRCRYYGSDTESFDPCDVCYSDTGDIYIADYNKSI